MVRMFSSAHAYVMNSTVREKQKGKSKSNMSCLIRDRQRMEVGTVHGPHNPPKHGHEDAESTLSLLHQSQGKSGKVTF